MKHRLFTPGPTPLPERVLRRMGSPLIHHRTDEFRRTMDHLHHRLQWLFDTSGPVVPLTSSGTGAMEATVVNLFSPGDCVITVNGGKFGERWTRLAETFGMNPQEILVPWGTALQPEQLREALHGAKDPRGVLLTHSETSTGTAIDLKAIAAMVRKEFPGTLLCVDGITSVGALELRFDAWGIDACVTGSQKGLMTPPGVAFVALSERARKAIELSTSRRMYFDLRRALAVLNSNDTPWTPAITLLQGVDEALDMMYEEGLENIWARHARHAKAARNGLAALGLKLFSQAPSNALTAAWLPESVVWKELHQTLQTRFGITVAGGQGDYAGKILRISHLGYYDDLDMVTVVAALERALILSGFPATPGEGISAVQKSLSEIENTRTP